MNEVPIISIKINQRRMENRKMGRLLIRIHLSLSDNLRETRDYKIGG